MDLEQYQWKSRLFLLFSPSGDDPAYLEQQRLLEGRESELAERETLVMHCVAGTSQAETACERFGVTNETFAAVLVGKDGTAKLVEHSPVTIDRVNSLIDGMPMRQLEQGA